MMHKTTLAIALTFGWFAGLTQAAEYVWTGEQGADWSTAANWRPDTGTPGRNDDVVITGLKGKSTISLSEDVALRSLTFDPGALYTCSLENRSLTLSDGAEVTFKELPRAVGMGQDASQTIASDVKLSGHVRLSNMNRWYLGGERLSFRGRISGNGSITIGGVTGGVVRFLGDNTDYEGSIIIESGALLVSHDAALGSGKDPIRLNGGSLTIGARVSTTRNILVAADASWDSHGPNGTHDGTITIHRGATWRVRNGGGNTKRWNLEKVLLILNGGKQRGVIRFGKNGEALTPEQLARIGFVDPAGYAPGTYTTRLTAEGELAPSGELVRPIDLPIDQSNKARARRRALCDVPGMTRLCGTETPLRQGMTISVFGDSITWGGGYIRLLQQALRDGEGSRTLGVKVNNHGLNGGGVLTIRDGEDSTNHAGKTKPLPFSQTIATDKADVAVIYIGVNDVWWRKTSPEVFEQALRDLVTHAKANKTVAVLATLAVMKEAVGNWNPKCEACAEITRKVARDTGTTLVDLRAGFIACLENESITVRPGGAWTSNGRLLNHDGIHTNGRGDRIIANLRVGVAAALQCRPGPVLAKLSQVGS